MLGTSNARDSCIQAHVLLFYHEQGVHFLPGMHTLFMQIMQPKCRLELAHCSQSVTDLN